MVKGIEMGGNREERPKGNRRVVEIAEKLLLEKIRRDFSSEFFEKLPKEEIAEAAAQIPERLYPDMDEASDDDIRETILGGGSLQDSVNRIADMHRDWMEV